MKTYKPLKAKACRWCNEKFTPRASLQVVCGINCSIKYAKSKTVDAKIKVLKEKLKTLGQYEKEARVEFQKWIRQRDKDRPCISCGVAQSPQFDAGHYFSANQFSGLIFDEDNVHKQCSRCNDFLAGNLLEYRNGLIKRFGLSFVSDLEVKKELGRNYKYTKDQLTDIKNEYKSRLK